MNKTKIEWVKSPYWEWTSDDGQIHISGGEQGYTWNPITGCLNGCEYCYARKLANGRLKERYLANTLTAPFTGEDSHKHLFSLSSPPWDRVNADPFYPRFWHRMITGGSPKGIFVCNMGELFGDWIPSYWQEVVFAQIKCFPQHRFYLLTKQPQNLVKWSPFPDHCYVGVTATDRLSFNMAINCLLKVEAKVKYISFEPLLSNPFEPPFSIPKVNDKDILLSTIDWVIIGSQTKPTVYPKDSWVWEIEQACDKAGIPVFEKDNLYPSGFRHLLRQEIPAMIGSIESVKEIDKLMREPTRRKRAGA